MKDEPNLVQVTQGLPTGSLAVNEYFKMRNRLYAAELSCSMTREENQRLQVELKGLREVANDTNTPHAYYHHGGVIYGVHGTSSIEYVNLLRQLILNFKDAVQRVVPEIQKKPAPELRPDQVKATNEFGAAVEADAFQPDPAIMQACEESRQRMNDLTREERDALEKYAREEIAVGAGKYIQELKDKLAVAEHRCSEAGKAERLARAQLADARQQRGEAQGYARALLQDLQSCQQENAELLKRVEQADVVQKKLCEQAVAQRLELEKADTTIKQLRLDRQAARDNYAKQMASKKA